MSLICHYCSTYKLMASTKTNRAMSIKGFRETKKHGLRNNKRKLDGENGKINKASAKPRW